MNSSHCPNPDELLAFALGKLSEEAIGQIAAHLDQCPACDATVADFDASSDTLIGGLRQPHAETELAEEPQYQQALLRVKAMVPGLPPAGAEATVGATAAALRLGKLGEYQLLEKLGQGGMGTVYKAIQTKLGRPVALKLLSPRAWRDPQAVARFQREMKAVGQLNHPNIVQAHGAGEIEGTHFLVMEYVDGLDLGRLAQRHGRLPVADACELVRQAAVGLQHAHEHGLVHRDIKPSNLMLGSLPSPAGGEAIPGQGTSHPSPAGAGVGGQGAQPQVKILDLGLALLKPKTPEGEKPEPAEPDDSVLTGADQILGTASYMAPEQASDSHHVDIRADIYSLGCTLYRLLAGRPPFPPAKYPSAAEQMAAHAQAPVPSIREQRPEVPEALAALMHRMLAKTPAERFATPAEVAEALAPFAAGSDLAALLAANRAPAGAEAPLSR